MFWDIIVIFMTNKGRKDIEDERWKEREEKERRGGKRRRERDSGELQESVDWFWFGINFWSASMRLKKYWALPLEKL